MIKFDLIELELLLKILVAAVLGLAIGIERKSKQYGLGSRTLMLISMGACLFTVVGSKYYETTNLARIAQGLAAGIGFIGAAIIWQQKQDHMWVHGLTTAVVVWIVTAIGFAVGAGMYLVAILAAIFVLVILLLKKMGFE